MQEAEDLQLLIRAAEAAGDVALGFFQSRNQVWDKPDGAGPVSEADLAVDTLLRETLTTACPTYGWLSEETADTPDRLSSECVFIVDPIDGTRSFVAGDTTWAHSLAVARQGKITAAVVFLPARDKIYTAALGQGAQKNGAGIVPSDTQKLHNSHILAAKPVMNPMNWVNGVPEIHRYHRPSLAYRLCLVAEGRFDAMLTLRQSWEWDIAAGALILSEAGAKTSDRSGKPLRFNNPHPQTDGVVAAGAKLHPEILEALSRK